MYDLIFFLVVIAVAYFVGTSIEALHYKQLKKMEKEYLSLPVVNARDIDYLNNIEGGEMVYGSVVISLDYFKRFLASLRMFFGGRVKSYESLLDRGRREAILRMKAQAIQKGYSVILNMRFETSSIGQVTAQKGSIGCFEVIAYGTAMRLKS